MSININAYFERIGFAGSIAPTLATLEMLHALHPAAIAFENIDPLMGVPVALDLASLEAKLVASRRGGFCLEHNTLLRAVLDELGFVVSAHAANVLWGTAGGAARPVSHMVLTVEIGGANWLADVGFGGPTPTAPLRLRAGVEQQTPLGTYRLENDGEGYRLELLDGETWRPLYRFDLAPRDDVEFEAINAMVTGPGGSMVDALLAARAEPTRRLSLLNARFTTRPSGGVPETVQLDSVDAMRDVLAQAFGIAPPPAERLEPVLQRALEARNEEPAP